jgi:excisionase family DNA binding protein
MINVEQFREVIRQEILSVINERKGGYNKDKHNHNDSLGDRPYLTISEAAKLTTLAASTIRLYIRRGKLKAEGVGRRRIIGRVELERFMAAETN